MCTVLLVNCQNVCRPLNCDSRSDGADNFTSALRMRVKNLLFCKPGGSCAINMGVDLISRLRSTGGVQVKSNRFNLELIGVDLVGVADVFFKST
jgi:hypothetical protein